MKEPHGTHITHQPTAENLSDRRLERAANHVAMHWFPINMQHLHKLIGAIKDGKYKNNSAALISNLKHDFALFTFVVKELITLAEAESVPASISADPIKLLTWAGVERISDILNSDASIPRSHDLSESDPLLLDRLKETSLVAATSEVLSTANNADKNVGFCNGLIREVGLNLVAWNYSSLNSRVIRSLTKSTTLDHELAKELGFSPSLLAFKFLRPKIVDANPEAKTLLQTWKTFDDLCDIGEALARAGNPETYPSAENDWRKANEFLQSSVGPNGINLIRARAIESTLVYRRALPNTFPSLEHFNPAVAIRAHQKSESRDNPHLPYCPPPVQSALRALYAHMPTKTVNKSVIEILIKEVIPRAGFSGGCIFLIDPSTMSLVPRTVIGNVTLRSLTPVALPRTQGSHMSTLIGDVLTTNHHLTDDFARVAFDSDQPILQRSIALDPNAKTGIYHRLGKDRRIGILYLEASEAEFNATGLKTLKVYKAIHLALCHALFVE
jgi:hypothetical protein